MQESPTTTVWPHIETNGRINITPKHLCKLGMLFIELKLIILTASDSAKKQTNRAAEVTQHGHCCGCKLLEDVKAGCPGISKEAFPVLRGVLAFYSTYKDL